MGSVCSGRFSWTVATWRLTRGQRRWKSFLAPFGLVFGGRVGDPRARHSNRAGGFARLGKSQAVIVGGISLEAAPPARQTRFNALSPDNPDQQQAQRDRARGRCRSSGPRTGSAISARAALLLDVPREPLGTDLGAYRPSIHGLDFHDRGAVVAADPESHRSGRVVHEHATDVSRLR